MREVRVRPGQPPDRTVRRQHEQRAGHPAEHGVREQDLVQAHFSEDFLKQRHVALFSSRERREMRPKHPRYTKYLRRAFAFNTQNQGKIALRESAN